MKGLFTFVLAGFCGAACAAPRNPARFRAVYQSGSADARGGRVLPVHWSAEAAVQ